MSWKRLSTVQRYVRVSRPQRSWVLLLVVVGLFAGAGIAAAAEEEDAAGDTLLNFGYDEGNHIFLVNTSPTDFTYDCTLENGTLTAEYGAADTGRIPVDMLLDEDKAAVLFGNRPAEEVGPDFTPADAPVAYAGADGDCGISGGVVGGPNGQVNHGQFMKLFHQLIDKRGMGCLNRVIAQSDLGKGDQQIRTPDVDATFAPDTSGQVDFTTVAAHCNRDRKDKGNNQQASGSGQGKKGKSNESGRPNSPGNSGNAPGHNK